MFCDHNMAEPYNQIDNSKDHAIIVYGHCLTVRNLHPNYFSFFFLASFVVVEELDWFMSCIFCSVTSNVG